MPQSATVVPLASVMPRVGLDVFAIGHPKAYGRYVDPMVAPTARATTIKLVPR